MIWCRVSLCSRESAEYSHGSKTIFMLIQFLASNLMRRLMGRKCCIKRIKQGPPTHRGTHTHALSLFACVSLSLVSPLFLMRTPSLSLVSVRPLFLMRTPLSLSLSLSWACAPSFFPRVQDHFYGYSIPGLQTYAEAHGEEILYHMDRGGPPHAQRYTHTLSCARPLSLFSMGTVRADTALFGQPLLVISARLYSQSRLLTLTHRALTVMKIMCVSVSQVYMAIENWGRSFPPPWHERLTQREARKAASQEAVAVLIREDRSMMMLLLQNRPATATWERMPHTQVLTHTHTHTVTPSAGSNTRQSFQKIAF